MSLARKLLAATTIVGAMAGFMLLAEAGVSRLWLFLAYFAAGVVVFVGLSVIKTRGRARFARAAGLGPVGAELTDEGAERGLEAVLETLLE